jgi:RNA polymerase sigma factor (sigma-70 family)
MERDTRAAAEIRDGLLRNERGAVDTVRGWVAAMVYGARWGLDDPEAAIQDVTMRILHLGNTGRIREETDFRSFVRTIARHECTDIYRRERLKSAVESRGIGVGRKQTSEDDPYNPYKRLERKEQRELLRFIYQALPEECRRIWSWLYGEGLSAAEIASRLGITAVNARVRAHRCLQKARKIHSEYAVGAAATTGSGHGE